MDDIWLAATLNERAATADKLQLAFGAERGGGGGGGEGRGG